MVAGSKIWRPSYVPMPSSMAAYFARSWAVVKRPACPAMPPIARERGSFTTPRSTFPVVSSISVGAMRNERGGRLKARVVHTQWRIDLVVRELRECLARQPLYDFAEQDVVRVAVNKCRARRHDRLLCQCLLQPSLIPAPGRAHIEIGRKTGEMRHQKTNCDRALTALEFRDVFRNRIIEPDLTLLEKLHDGRRRRDDFGERGCVEDRIECHRLAGGNQCPGAICLLVNDPAVVTNGHDSARNHVGSHRFINDCVYLRELILSPAESPEQKMCEQSSSAGSFHVERPAYRGEFVKFSGTKPTGAELRPIVAVEISELHCFGEMFGGNLLRAVEIGHRTRNAKHAIQPASGQIHPADRKS